VIGSCAAVKLQLSYLWFTSLLKYVLQMLEYSMLWQK